jgi:hypothetical protein
MLGYMTLEQVDYYTDSFTASRTLAFVLVQSCQPHKHRQSVEKPCYATVVAVLV